MNKKLTESLENYLETIGMLIRKNKIARVKDISKELKVKNSSVNIALNILADKGLVIHEKYGYVELTKEGKQIADDIQYKEDVLLRFFTEVLGVDKRLSNGTHKFTISDDDKNIIKNAISYLHSLRWSLYVMHRKLFFPVSCLQQR